MDKIASLFDGLTASIEIEIKLDEKPGQRFHKVKNGPGGEMKLPIYTGTDGISGEITVDLKGNKKYEHLGIKCFLIGFLEIFSDKNLSTEFQSISKELVPAGILTENKSYRFAFTNFEKDYETFDGVAGRVRYFIRATVNRNYKTTITKEVDFAVLKPDVSIEETESFPMKLEVGIEECLHIEFEWDKSYYHLKDVIKGNVSFRLVKLKIKSMEIHLVRKETFGTGKTTETKTQNVVSYQVMDGCPVGFEIVPIRMFLSGVKLSPSYKNIHNRLSVKYWINLVLLDEEDRKYFKQTEITIYRKLW